MAETILSVYGTVFNSKDSIKIAVDNIYKTFFGIKDHIEIVIVDNYSTDGTYEVLQELSETYNLLLYRHKSTRGLGRNIAFTKTQGKYVINHDFDDIYIDDTMFKVIRNFDNLLEKDVIINQLSRRQIIEKIGNWSSLNAGEDVELRARAVKNRIRLFAIPAIIGMNYKILNNSRNGPTLINENRYTKNKISYIKRMSSWLIDTSVGYGVNITDLKKMNSYYKMAFLYGIIGRKFERRKSYRYFKDYNNLEIAEMHKEFLDPSLFDIPRDRWVTTISAYIDETIYKKLIGDLRTLGYNHITKTRGNILISYNDTYPNYI